MAGLVDEGVWEAFDRLEAATESARQGFEGELEALREETAGRLAEMRKRVKGRLAAIDEERKELARALRKMD